MSTLYPDLPFTAWPDSAQTFVTMQNILASDGDNVKGFQEAMESGNAALAQHYYANITNADAKFIDATKMNTLFQTCVALQRFYKTDVQPYITSKQAEWQSQLDQFDYVGAFSATKQYVPNNWVSFTQADGTVLLYICIATPPIGAYPTDTNYWRQFTVKGERGISGAGLSFTGAWNSTHTYKVGDVVSYANGVWGALQASTNNYPYQGSSYWRLIYRSAPVIYPVQATQPTGQEAGDLWFKVVD